MKFLASSLVLIGVCFGLQSHAGVTVVMHENGFRIVVTGAKAPTTSEELAEIARALPSASLESFHETLQLLRSPQVLDLLGMNRDLADQIVKGARERLSHRDCASLQALARTAYLAADVEAFQGRNHPGLYFKNYLALKELGALVLKQIGTALDVSADDALTALRSPEMIRSLAHESNTLLPEQLRMPATTTTLRDFFEFAAQKDIFASYRTFNSFVYLYIADDSARQVFKAATTGSTLSAFEVANHARFLTLVDDLNLEFALARLQEVSGASAYEYAEEVLRTHRMSSMAVDNTTLERFLNLVRDLNRATRATVENASTSRDDVIEGLRRLQSLRQVAASQLSEFKKRGPNKYWRDLYRDVFSIGVVQYTFAGESVVPPRTYAIEPVIRLNSVSIHACELLFAP